MQKFDYLLWIHEKVPFLVVCTFRKLNKKCTFLGFKLYIQIDAVLDS